MNKILQTAVNWFGNIYRTRSEDWTYGWYEKDEVLDPGNVYFLILTFSVEIL
ncbi:MAG: hypothetical protein GY799_10220 [Desulfobulbaceae bacterium]|nr:hypothetical protein [Desulfobulbaceae bacterium]